MAIGDMTENPALKIVEQIESGDYKLLETLKDSPRSKVLKISLNGLILVLKYPIEKNRRAWIRLLTLVRLGEAFKNLLSMQLLISNRIRTTKPYLACEYRKYGMVHNSWLLYYYLEGEACLDKPKTFARVVDLLKTMHRKNILHGDPQIRNFILSENELYVIDANPKRASSAYGRAYEFAYLRKSQPEIERYFGPMATSRNYHLAIRLDRLDRKMARFRRAFKRFIGLKR